MSMRVIELNDATLRVIGAEGVIFSSPGFALLDGKQLQLGEVAERQARLRPTQSYNKFWQQLSLEPLSNTPPTVRHFADMAFAHLQQVAQAADVSGDVILAVPGHFSHQQLAILLGLMRHSPFNPVGVVDAAVAAAAALARDGVVIYADMQLHQVLLTRLSHRDGMLQRDAVLQIPGVGSHNFMDLLMQLATSLFIQQSRFNPQHNGESEQQLYNELPRWLRQSHDPSSNLMMELTFGSNIYQAKLPGENLVRRLEDYYSRINDKIRTLADDDACQLLIAQNLAQYPGYLNSLGGTAVEVVTPETLGRNCGLLHEHISSPGGEFRFVTQLPMLIGNEGSRAQPATATATPENTPTHVLVGHRALPLGRVEVSNGKSHNGSPLDGHVIQLQLAGLPDHLGNFERQGGQVVMSCGDAGALVNGMRVSGRQALQLGDRIRFTPSGEELVMIRVQNGQA